MCTSHGTRKQNDEFKPKFFYYKFILKIIASPEQLMKESLT